MPRITRDIINEMQSHIDEVNMNNVEFYSDEDRGEFNKFPNRNQIHEMLKNHFESLGSLQFDYHGYGEMGISYAGEEPISESDWKTIGDELQSILNENLAGSYEVAVEGTSGIVSRETSPSDTNKKRGR